MKFEILEVNKNVVTAKEVESGEILIMAFSDEQLGNRNFILNKFKKLFNGNYNKIQAGEVLEDNTTINIDNIEFGVV